MSEESREQRWARLINDEAEAAERAMRNAEGAGPDRLANLAKDWFAASSRLLKEHMRSHCVAHEGGPLEPYPWEAIWRAANLMETLSTGNLPDVVTCVTGTGGRPDRWPAARRDIATALHYIALAKRGEVQDRSFIVTVAEAFGVDRTAVHRWQKNREVICDGIPEIHVDNFPEALHEAGARYHFHRTNERTEGVE